jgi:hypothetical protein
MEYIPYSETPHVRTGTPWPFTTQLRINSHAGVTHRTRPYFDVPLPYYMITPPFPAQLMRNGVHLRSPAPAALDALLQNPTIRQLQDFP